jgi:hypothetical protein
MLKTFELKRAAPRLPSRKLRLGNNSRSIRVLLHGNSLPQSGLCKIRFATPIFCDMTAPFVERRTFRYGSVAPIWSSADYFRSSPGNGHCQGRSPCLKGASMRHWKWKRPSTKGRLIRLYTKLRVEICASAWSPHAFGHRADRRRNVSPKARLPHQ